MSYKSDSPFESNSTTESSFEETDTLLSSRVE